MSWLPPTTPHRLVIIPNATHNFEEPGTLRSVTAHAIEWFHKYSQAKKQLVSEEEVCETAKAKNKFAVLGREDNWEGKLEKEAKSSEERVQSVDETGQ